MNTNEGFINDVQSTVRQQAMNVCDTAVSGVFDRKHREFCLAGFHSLNGFFERAAGQSFHFRTAVATGFVRVSAGLSLECDALGHFNFSVFFPKWAIGRGNYTLLATRESNRYAQNDA